MFESTVTFDIKMIKGMTNILLGGAGLFLAIQRTGANWATLDDREQDRGTAGIIHAQADQLATKQFAMGTFPSLVSAMESKGRICVRMMQIEFAIRLESCRIAQNQ